MNNLPCVATIETNRYLAKQEEKNAKTERIGQFKDGHIDDFKDGFMEVDERDQIIENWFEGSGNVCTLINALHFAKTDAQVVDAKNDITNDIIRVCDEDFERLGKQEFDQEQRERGL